MKSAVNHLEKVMEREGERERGGERGREREPCDGDSAAFCEPQGKCHEVVH